MHHILVFVVFLVAIGGGLGLIAQRVNAARALELQRCPTGELAPDSGPLPSSNVHGGLYDGPRHAGNDNPTRGDYGHLLPGATVSGSCDSPVGGGPPNCGGGCDNITPATKWLLVDQISVVRLGAGQNVNVNLRGAQPIDAFGRHAHIVGIRFVGKARYTLGATNDAYSGYQQLAVWARIFLERKSWQYAASLDGRKLYNDRWIRSFSQSSLDNPPPDITVNQGAGDVDVDTTLYWPLTLPYARGIDALKGSIPLRSLQANGDSSFRFGAPKSLVGAPNGITPKGFVDDDVEVWLELAYPDGGVFLDRPWQLEDYEDVNRSGNLRRCERTTEYAAICHEPEDEGGQYITDYDGFTVQIAGQTEKSAYTLAQMRTDTLSVLDEDPRWVDSVPSLVVNGAARILFLTGPIPRVVSGMASGDIGFKYAIRQRPQSHYLHRTIACHDMDGINALGMQGRPMFGINHDGTYAKNANGQIVTDKSLPIVVK